MEVKIFTSSHGTEFHHFPQTLAQIFAENSFIQYPLIDAEPGRMFHATFFKKYKEDFEGIQNQDTPRISVIIIGDNNIRNEAFRGGFRILQMAGKLIELHKGTIHPLLFFGLMPSPITHCSTYQLAEYSDSRVEDLFKAAQKESQTNGKLFTFVRLSEFFEDEGSVMRDLFFEKDKIHLNQKGAQTLAQQILRFATQVAENYQKY